ncbi:MAG: hypothetical protein A2452_11365 [Candidatus Firestonebacteria bacterium RIFOXYC2_FULL_39_67]|nr:MAG: hypothetical protein A2536_09995 [Candidatus Firestonebacteria bacterium RIFOXYD2_FULL_39_29]OGF54544.1 MAG: hypothetical protein A2452_11365 [Candidatus Firestonebacteria bacterium RIFOXYC2_FULL_39_67]
MRKTASKVREAQTANTVSTEDKKYSLVASVLWREEKQEKKVQEKIFPYHFNLLLLMLLRELRH